MSRWKDLLYELKMISSSMTPALRALWNHAINAQHALGMAEVTRTRAGVAAVRRDILNGHAEALIRHDRILNNQPTTGRHVRPLETM